MSLPPQLKRLAWIATVVVFLFGIVAVSVWDRPGDEVDPPALAEVGKTAASEETPRTPEIPDGMRVLADAPFAVEFGKEGTSAQRELELLQLAFSDYLQFVKPRYRRPFGNNADLVFLLSGNNPYRIAAIPPGHTRIDGQGRLVDRWGVPFDVHPLSATAIELRSAGPDKILWNEDDLRNATVSGQDVLDRMAGPTPSSGSAEQQPGGS